MCRQVRTLLLKPSDPLCECAVKQDVCNRPLTGNAWITVCLRAPMLTLQASTGLIHKP